MKHSTNQPFSSVPHSNQPSQEDMIRLHNFCWINHNSIQIVNYKMFAEYFIFSFSTDIIYLGTDAGSAGLGLPLQQNCHSREAVKNGKHRPFSRFCISHFLFFSNYHFPFSDRNQCQVRITFYVVIWRRNRFDTSNSMQ